MDMVFSIALDFFPLPYIWFNMNKKKLSGKEKAYDVLVLAQAV